MSSAQRANHERRGRDRRHPARAATRAGLGLGLGLVLALATGAQAAPPMSKVTISRADGAKPAQPAPAAAPVARPELAADQVLWLDELGGPIRAEQEQILTDLISSTSDAQVDEKSQYYFMLGELHARQHRLWRQKSVELAARAAETKDAKVKAEATAATEKAKQYLLKTVRTYKGLTDNLAFRNFPKMDIALFYYGYTLQSGAYMAEARQVFDKLLKDYPTSKYVPDAHLVFAEYFFATGQLGDAETRYRYIQKFPKSSAYWFAMYKLGWIHLGVQRYQEALETFFQVVQATKSDKKLERLGHASLRGFVVAYAEIGKPDKAAPAFQRVDRQQAPAMLADLADRYFEQGKNDKAIAVYQALLKAAPDDQNACSWQYNIACATAFGVSAPQVVEVCTQDAGAFKEWARTSGVRVWCVDCARDLTPP
ncbi:MAG TPA: tetratricopeptide repeat protein [Kofleriaceae bacterium]|nr:tetratricopeptide repeat protein [Kofleriaceae bacterium]